MRVNKLFNYKFKNNHIVTKITDNSIDCIFNSVFIVNGKNIEFLNDAITRGAKTIVSEFSLNLDFGLNNYIVDDVKIYQAKLLCKFYKKVIDQYTIIGITGTNGKTSTCNYVYNYLRLLQEDVLLISSNGIFLDGLKFETLNTTPSIYKIYEFMNKNLNKNMFTKKKHKKHYLILECSSQGIRNLRIKHIPLDIVLFTNITSDHLDYHLNISDYLFSKCLILNNLKPNGVVILNNNNEHSQLIKEISNNNYYIIGTGEKISYKIISSGLTNTIFELQDCSNFKLIETKLVGKFQIDNLLSAYAILKTLKLNLNGFREFCYDIEPVAGRFNYYQINKKHIVIDYAHTFSATSTIIDFVKEHFKNKLWIVVGCGGCRDRTKRSLIGEYTSMSSNYTIFTEDNNRSESFESIINDITSNISSENYIIIKNRYDAIKYALECSEEDDLILILGKGTEKTKIDNKYLTDYEMVCEILND